MLRCGGSYQDFAIERLRRGPGLSISLGFGEGIYYRGIIIYFQMLYMVEKLVRIRGPWRLGERVLSGGPSSIIA